MLIPEADVLIYKIERVGLSALKDVQRVLSLFKKFIPAVHTQQGKSHIPLLWFITAGKKTSQKGKFPRRLEFIPQP